MADKPIEIDAHKITLRDSNGRKRAMLTTGDDGEAFLSFFSKSGKPKVAMGLTDQDECRLIFLDDEGYQRVNLAFLPNGQAAIMCMGGEGKPSVGIRGGWDEGCGLVAVSGLGKVRAHVGIDANGYPNLCVLNPDGQMVWNAVQAEGTRASKGGIIVPEGPKIG